MITTEGYNTLYISFAFNLILLNFLCSWMFFFPINFGVINPHIKHDTEADLDIDTKVDIQLYEHSTYSLIYSVLYKFCYKSSFWPIFKIAV